MPLSSLTTNLEAFTLDKNLRRYDLFNSLAGAAPLLRLPHPLLGQNDQA
jgi:hypothetical protein